jgi:hypothetical protein
MFMQLREALRILLEKMRALPDAVAVEQIAAMIGYPDLLARQGM